MELHALCFLCHRSVEVSMKFLLLCKSLDIASASQMSNQWTLNLCGEMTLWVLWVAEDQCDKTHTLRFRPHVLFVFPHTGTKWGIIVNGCIMSPFSPIFSKKKKAFRKWGVFTLQLVKVFWLEKYFYYLCSVQKLGYKFLEYLSANSCSGPFDTDSIYFQNNKVQIMAFFPWHFLFPRTHYSVSLGSPFFIVLLTV